MAVIHIFTLDSNISDRIKNNQFSEDQIVNLYNTFKMQQKTKMKGFFVALAILFAAMIGYGVPVLIIKIGLPEAWPYIGIVLLIYGIIAFASWYFSMGAIKIKWNRLIKKYYYGMYENCKL